MFSISAFLQVRIVAQSICSKVSVQKYKSCLPNSQRTQFRHCQQFDSFIVERNAKIEEKPFFRPMSLVSNTKATQPASQASRAVCESICDFRCIRLIIDNGTHL
jgi:hypothetical protein